MTIQELKEKLESTQMPVAYWSWPIKQAPALPYLIYYTRDNDDVYADNQNYRDIVNINIELYTEKKDFDTERQVEQVLKDNDIKYQKTSSYLRSEVMFETLYEITIIQD